MSEDALRKQLQDISQLYDSEKSENASLKSAVTDFRRREPLVEMLWQETLVLRGIIEKQLISGNILSALPSGRFSTPSKTLSAQDKLGIAMLTSVNNNFVVEGAPSLVNQQGPAGGNDAISSAMYASQQRQAQYQQQAAVAQEQTQYTKQTSGPDDTRPDDTLPLPPTFDALPSLSPEVAPPAPAAEDVPEVPHLLPIAASGFPAPPVIAGVVARPASEQPAVRSAAPASAAPAAAARPVNPLLAGIQGGMTLKKTDGDAPARPVNPLLAGIQGGMALKKAGSAPPTTGGAAAPAAAPAVVAAPVVPVGPQPSKAMIKPTKKMRQLHWKPIIIGNPNERSDISKKSIWMNVDGIHDKVVKALDTMELENRFSAVISKKPIAVESNDKKDIPADDGKPKSVLDGKRSQQLAIMLAKMPNNELMKKAILTADNSILTADQVDSLHKNLFTTEEVEMVKACGYPPNRLQTAEQWILAQCDIPQLNARLECWKFVLTFQALHKDVSDSTLSIINACEVLTFSPAFKTCLANVLVLGNYLNGGTPRGQADGFHMEDLTKLARQKDNDNHSLMEYLVKVLAKQYGGSFLEGLKAETDIVSAIKGYNLKTLQADCRRLMGKVNLVGKMRSLVNAQPGSDVFEKAVGKKIDEYASMVEKLDEVSKKANDTFVKMVLYLEPDLMQGKAEQINSDEYFTIIDEFFTGVTSIYEEEKRRAAAEEENSKKQTHMMELKKALSVAKPKKP